MAGRSSAGLSLLFAAGDRPTLDDIRKLVLDGGGRHAGFSISHQPPAEEGWLELLSSGLTFDLHGLAPASAASWPPVRLYLGVPETPEVKALEALTLTPGPHLAGGEAMIPVVRVMVALASQMAEAFGAVAICWHPAESCMEAAYFGRVAEDWLFGGPFPALGLTAISERPGGGVESRGLAFFIGQEIAVDAFARETTSDVVKRAVRAIDYLITHGPLRGKQELVSPDGEAVTAEAGGDGRIVHLRRAG